MKNKRITLTKKIRFDVFKRDSFTCSYCGNKPPNVTLEVDHIIPVSKNGTNDIDNLITSCFDCNRGKGKNELGCLPETTIEKIERLKEQELQYKEFKKILSKIKNRKLDEINKIEAIFTSMFGNYSFTETFKNKTIKMFIDKLGFNEVEEAMELAVDTIEFPSDATKYFCGICWNKIRNNG